MLHTTIELKPDYKKAGISHSDTVAKLTTYIIDHHSEFRGDKTRPMILICPGGGYMHLSSREAEPIALRMNAHGYNACILYYSLAPDMCPSQLLEAAMAVDYIKKHAEKWHVNNEKICICGFSAGAHVAGSLGTMWKDELITEVLGGESMDYRPSCMLLSYPVITASEFSTGTAPSSKVCHIKVGTVSEFTLFSSDTVSYNFSSPPTSASKEPR